MRALSAWSSPDDNAFHIARRGAIGVESALVRATAVVLESHLRQPRGAGAEGEPYWWDLAPSFLGVGGEKYDLVLEVHPPGAESYRVGGRFKVPRTFKGGGIQRLWRRTSVQPGLEVPVDVDDRNPQKIKIDWDAFGADGGGYDRMESNRIGDHRRRLRQRSPKAWEAQREIERSQIASRIEITRSGHFSREEFEQFLREGVEAEFFTPQEADEARRAVDAR